METVNVATDNLVRSKRRNLLAYVRLSLAEHFLQRLVDVNDVVAFIGHLLIYT